MSRSNILERIKRRDGYVRRWVNANEMDHYLENDWARAKAEKGEKDTLADQVTDKMYLIELPEGKYQSYEHENMGGRERQLQAEAINANREEKDKDGRVMSGETISLETKELPREAFIKRDK